MLREGIDAAYEFGSIVSIDFAFVVGYHFLHRRGDIVFIQRQNEHFVIAEQIPFYSFTKTDTIDLFSKQPHIIHGTKDGFGFSSFGFCFSAVKPWCCGHIEPLFPFEEIVVVHFGKCRFILSGQRHPCGPVSFVAYNQIKLPIALI